LFDPELLRADRRILGRDDPLGSAQRLKRGEALADLEPAAILDTQAIVHLRPKPFDGDPAVEPTGVNPAGATDVLHYLPTMMTS
jgi:hypothetical protein